MNDPVHDAGSRADRPPARLYLPRWRGQRGRVEVWYATATDPADGTGLWIHHETVATDDGGAHAHGWAALFPQAGDPVCERFGPWPVASGNPPGDGAYFGSGSVTASPDRLSGDAGELSWRLQVTNGGRPLWTFPRWTWEREMLPAAQIVPAPSASFTGEVTAAARRFTFTAAPGAVARIYGHGNALRWGWLHADLGGGDVLEVVAAVSRRAGMRRLPPLPFVQLRLGGRDWPRDPLSAGPLFRARLGLPSWSVRGAVGRRRLRVEVSQPADRCVALTYHDPDGAAATCTNSEIASADVLLERWSGRWRTERHWRLDGTAHAEVGTRPDRAVTAI
ncbi:MAG: hypothetical protein ACRDPK_10175 [Carbonactinosporaceae bacterium]